MSLTEKEKERRKSYYKRNKEKIKYIPVIERRSRLKRYGLTIEEFEVIKIAQNGLCAICNEAFDSKKRNCHIDHNHSTRKVRGLLCSRCNKGLGLFKDNKENLISALRYLNV